MRIETQIDGQINGREPNRLRRRAPQQQKLGRAVTRPKFREETPKTIIATGAGEAIAGTGVRRCFYMSAGLRNFN